MQFFLCRKQWLFIVSVTRVTEAHYMTAVRIRDAYKTTLSGAEY
jgi:hypothetical protein